MKKSTKIVTMLTICIMAATLCCFAGCQPTTNPTTKTQPLSFENTMNYSAIGGIGMLTGGTATNVSTMLSGSGSGITMLASAPSATFSQEEKDEFIRNLNIAQATLGNGAIKQEVKPSDREEYSTFYTITATDITGETKTYSFYYNEVNDPANVSENEENVDEDEEDEQEIHIVGIVVLDGVEYTLTGDKEIEGSGKDQEVEIKFNIKMDESKYVIIEQEMEEGEQEFSYSLYENGKLVSKSEVEYEQEEDGEIELTFSTRTKTSKMEYSYEFVTTEEGKFVEIKFKATAQANKKALIKILENELGEVTYEFIEQNNASGDKNNKTEESNKPSTQPDDNTEEQSI